MNTKPLFTGEILVEITQGRYEELVANEAELFILKAAISKMSGHENIDHFKTMFGIEEEVTDE